MSIIRYVDEAGDRAAGESVRELAPKILLQQNIQLQLLSELAGELLAARDPIETVRQLFDSIAGQFDVDVGFHYAVDEGGGGLRLAAYLGILAEEARRIERLAYGQAICGTVAETRQALYFSHIQQLDDPKAQLVKGYGVRAYACYPLLVDEELLGTLSFASRCRDTFAPEELAFFRTISQYIALAQKRLRAEAELNASQQRLQAVIDSSLDSILLADDEARYVIANPAACKLLGYSREELLQMRVWDIMPGQNQEEGLRLWETFLASGELTGEYAVQRKDGSTRTVEFEAVAHIQPGVHLSVLHDITERRRLSEENQQQREQRERLLAELAEEHARLEELAATLEERVEERTVQVLELASELTLAEQRERRRIAQLLHDDIQQMLTALQLNLHLMIPEANAGVQARLQEMVGFTQEIVSAARTLSVELSPPVVESDYMEDAFAWLAALMKERYGLAVDLEVEDACCVTDRNRRELVLQMVRELLFNVVKHAGVHEARLIGRAEGEQMVVEVVDDGAGFEVGVERGGNDHLTGFGLYSIRERLSLFGGSFEVASMPGGGTRATIRLPVA